MESWKATVNDNHQESCFSKYEEIYPPELSEFVYITDDTYSKEDVGSNWIAFLFIFLCFMSRNFFTKGNYE